jgi:O-antigen ligase
MALAAGVSTLLLVLFRRRTLFAIGLLSVALVGAALLLAPMRDRLEQAARRARTGDLNLVLSGRLPSFLSAWEMFRLNPVTGVGPGAFAGEYFDHRLRSDVRYPRLSHWSPELGEPINFGEAHSDQLQVLAEQGVIGYALFLAGLAALARRSLMKAPESETEGERFARYLAAPLAVSAWALALAQFPFQLAAFTVTFVVLAATCFAWRPEARDA